MRGVFRVLLFSLLSTCCLAGSIVYLRVHRGAIEERLKAPPQTSTEKIRKLRTQFAAAGCTSNELYEQTVARQDFPNLICKMPGEGPGTIVIGAPMDPVATGPEDDTQWATLSLLPLLAESLGSVRHRLSFTFVAFSGQQHGLRGASEYLKQLTKSQHQEIRAMINLADIGRTPVVYALAQDDLVLANWLTLSSTTLRDRSKPMEITARSLDAQLTNGVSNFSIDDYLVDAKAFQHDHIPAISLRSAPLSMLQAMRQAGAWSGSSSGKSLDLDVYEQTYNVLCVYLLYLDGNLNNQHPSPTDTEVVAASTLPNTTAPKDSQSPAAAVPNAESSGTRGSSETASGTAPAAVGQRQLASAPPDIPVFHAETQLVVMDVSVTDARGLPVKGLQSGDFTLLENGKPQAVRVFEAHGSQGLNQEAIEHPLPPGTYSNRISAKADSPLNIFLFDLLNTPPQDQAYARAQMLEFLRSVPRGKHIGLFVLGKRLEMVQEFTDDPEALVKTVERIMRDASPLLTTELQRQEEQGFTEEIGRYAGPDSVATAPGGLPAAAAAGLPGRVNDSKSFIGSVGQRTAASANTNSMRDDQRATFTLEALSAIGRTVAGYPGRKNLVWLSGSFSIRLRPSRTTTLSATGRSTQAAAPVTDSATNFSYEDVIRRLTTVMATARIAIYPIDVRGLRTGGVEIAVGGDQSRSFVDPSSSDAFNFTLLNQSETRFGERSSMLDLAQQTGGHVSLDNDVRGAIARSLEDGSNYYTLAYTPDKNNSDKSFRNVQIKVNRESVVLAYRPGYYPTQSREALSQSGAHMLAAAMQPGVPQSTMLSVTVRVLPPDASSKAVRIDYSIDLNGIDFQDIADSQKRAVLDCMAVALDGNGNIAGQIANTMDAALRPEEFPSFQRTGLPMHQELILPAGTYDLRVGVLDRSSQRIGTINVPVSISAETKAN